MRRRELLVGAAGMVLAGCGYRVAGKADLLPKSLRTIAIQPFSNPTTRYRLTDRLPAMITREFIRRTRYEVISDSNQADAVLTGGVIGYNAFPTVFDQRTGRAAGVQMLVILDVRLTERATGAVLFERRNFEARQRYEISVDPLAYFEESSTALDRLAADVSRQVVSAILESF
jgi:hypothetical protein